MAPRYSIVVPTCDRGFLLEHTLRGILAVPRQDIEIIVSDNASTDETAAIIESARKDPRVVPLRTDRRLPMPTHWDFAFSKASADFVIVNGDDDGFSLNLLDTLDAVIGKFDAKIITWRCGLYHHPGYDVEGTPNTFHFRAGHSGLALIMDPTKIVEQFSKFDFDFFPEGTRIALRRDLAAEIVRRTGRLYWPPNPDFSAPLLCLLQCKPGDCVYLDVLLGFGGRSLNSNGACFIKGASPERAINFMKEFADENVYPFHEPPLPFYYNSHAAALSVARHFFKQEVGDLHPDQFLLFKTIYEELNGIRYNPFIDGKIESSLDQYLENANDEVRKAALTAKQSVEQVTRSKHINLTRGLKRLRPILMKYVPFRKAIKRKVLQIAFGDDAFAGRQYNCSVAGSPKSFNNGYDLMRCFVSVTASYDPVRFNSVERALKKGVLISAHRI